MYNKFYWEIGRILMGGTMPYCPFCGRLLVSVKDHIKAKHPDKYKQWILDGQQPYWKYDDNGELKSYSK